MRVWAACKSESFKALSRGWWPGQASGKRMTAMVKAVALVLLCGGAAADEHSAPLEPELVFKHFRELPVPSGLGAREPNLTVSETGQIHLAWLEQSSASSASLKLSQLSDSGWLPARTIATGTNWFINWADFPSVTAFGDSGLAATWLAKNGRGDYAYDLNVSWSHDGGKTWSEPFIPHLDGTATQHGLASVLPWGDGRLFVAWLDGRLNAENARATADLPTDDMSLFATVIDTGGTHAAAAEVSLDERVCTCCSTAAVMTDNGALLAYRDRSENEVRDLAVRRWHDGQWTEARPIHADGWTIAGCPINGPALAAQGTRIAAGWFTAAGNRPRVLLAYSDDAGEHFSEPVRVDDGRPLGRIDVLLLNDGSSLVSWLEVGSLGEELRVRHILADGARGEARTLASSNQGRTMGFPRMARQANEVYFAWTRSGQSLSVRTAVLSLSME